MNIAEIVNKLRDCECGREHKVDIKAVEIGHGMLKNTAEILKRNNFPTKILVVADKNSLKASDGILEVLENGGITYELKLYDDLREAEADDAADVAKASAMYEGILSVGSGSCNDICRRAALLADKDFAIFATAPSMDGFASGTSPISHNNFKQTLPARQPSIIIGDTTILAAAPAELKAAGFGDLIAKYVALVDWRVSNLTTGEYYCEHIAQISRDVMKRISANAHLVQSSDEETVGNMMEALVLSGLLMKLADSVRIASRTEHIISHFWEIKKMEKGLISDFHGKKCGVASLFTSRIYYDILSRENVKFHADNTDWDKVYEIYGEQVRPEIEKLNNPTVTDETTVEILEKNWDKIRSIIKEELPSPEEVERLLKTAGCATTIEEIAVDRDLGLNGVMYHPYMRHRMTLMRLLPMTDIKIDWENVLRG